MAIGYCDTSNIMAIADSIRSKTGKTDSMTLDTMPTEIESISVGGGKGEIIVTKATSGDTNYTKNLINRGNLYKHIKCQSLNVYKELSDGRKRWSKILFYDNSAVYSSEYNILLTSYSYYSSSNNSMSYLSAEKIIFRNLKINFSSLCQLYKDDYISAGYINSVQFDNCSCGGYSSFSMYHCFYDEKGGVFRAIDFGNLDTSNVGDMTDMFYGGTSLTSLTLGPNWGSNTKITSFDISPCPLTHDSCLDVFNKLADKTQTATTSATLKLNSTTKALMSADEIKIATDKGWTVS